MATRFHLARAARILRTGGVVAYPTEAVFGIGCLPDRRGAVARIARIKRRPASKGFILIAAELAQLASLIELPEEPRRAEVLASWPGPVTRVRPARPTAPRWLKGRRGTLAVRVTAYEPARELCRGAGSALLSTSANRAGRRPARTALRARLAVGRAVDYVLPGAVGGLARPTSIRDGATGRTLRNA